MSAVSRMARRGVERYWVIVAALVAWQLATANAESIYFPEPTTILERIQELWFSAGVGSVFVTDTFAEQMTSTVGRLLLGWGIASLLGVVVGVALGLSRRLGDYVDPTLHFLRSLPVAAVIPIFLILLGTGFQMRIALVVFASIWPVLLNTADGVRGIAPQMLRTGEAFRIPRRAQILRIVVPAASPSIFAGLRVSLSFALIVTVLSEMFASSEGLGKELIAAQRSFAMEDLWAYIVLLAVLGVVLNAVLEAVEHRVLAWHIGARRRDNAT